jgi:beta-lactamase regulating signal transducer with metallopeptidase domain
MNREQILPAMSAVSIGLLIPLADASLKGALLLALTLLVTLILRQRSAAVRHLAWTSALALLLVLPILSAVLPGWSVLPDSWGLSWRPGVETAVATTVPPASPQPMQPAVIEIPVDESERVGHSQPEILQALNENTAPPLEVPSTNPVVVPSPGAPTKSLPSVPAPNFLAVSIFTLWLCGLLLLGIRLASSWLSLRRLTRTSIELTSGPIFDEFQICCRELGVTRPVQLLQGDANAMPMAWGFVRSHILVPNVCEDWPSAQRRAVLLHELGHVLRRDPLWHALTQVATAVYWFHPLVWLAAWRIHIERERACDDLVLNRGVGAHDYAGHLLDIVSQGRFRRIGASVGVAMASSNKLEGRVRSILDHRQDRRPMTPLLLTTGLLIAVAVGTPLAMMRAAERSSEDAAKDRTDKTGSDETSEEVAEVTDETAAPDPVVQLQSAHIHFADSMLVVWNERGALGLVFEPPASEGRSTEVAYRWRFHDGTEQETISEGTLPLGQGEQIMVFSGMSLVVTDATADAATISYDPASVCVHPLDRTFFSEYDRQIPSQPELRPAVDLAEFILPDEGVQQQMREDDYVGQGTIPGYPRVPLPFKIRYAENGLVVATPDGVAVFDFVGPIDRSEGIENRHGAEYRWRFVSADGATDETGTGEVWEFLRGDNSIYDESLHYIEAGPIHISWSINVDEAGWIYYDPAWHGVWLIAPDTAAELAAGESDVSELQQFAFGPRAVPTVEVSATDDELENSETTIRGFDLTPYRFTGDWSSLYDPGAPLDRDMPIADGGCWVSIVQPMDWRVHYSPVRGDFYVHRTTRYGSRQEVAEADYYGPIPGNPLELLELEDYLAEAINRHHATNAPGNSGAMAECQFLLTSKHPTLVASGFRVIAGITELEVFEERYISQMVTEAGAAVDQTPELHALHRMAIAALANHQHRIYQRQVEIDDAQYAPGSDPNADELAADWGEPVDGLSLAIVPWEQGEPTLRLGERVEAWLVVRNVSDEPIRLATMGGMGGVSTTLVDEETNEELQVLFPFFDGVGYGIVDGLGIPRRFQLEPGQVLHVKNPAFWAGAGDIADLAAQINVSPGHTYRLTMSLQLPEAFNKDDEGRITLPARGEFSNSLTSGTVRIRVIEIDGTVPPQSGEVDVNDAQSNALPANENESGFSRSLHGFDLTPHRFPGSFPGDWDALFEPGGQLDRRVPVALGGYWGCRVNSHAWTMYYSPLKHNFYVHLRDGDLSEYFGPIEGNGIELLKIEEHLVNSFNRAIGTDLVETSFNLRNIQRLIDSGEPTLMASGLRALTQLRELSIDEEHNLRPVVERVANDAMEVPELSDLTDAAVAYMDQQHARIEALKVTIDDSEYTPGRAPTTEELAAQWGPEVDGLSLAVVSWYMHPFDSPANLYPPGERLGMTNWQAGEAPALAAGDIIGSILVIRNVSDEPRRIATLNTMDGVSAIMTDEETGHSAFLDYPHVSGIATKERYLLQSGQVVTFKQSQISVVEGDLHSEDRPFDPDNREFLYGEIRVREGRAYTIDYSVDVPSAFSYVEDGRIALPAAGEFFGKLTAPQIRFEVAAVATAAVDDARSDAQPGELTVLHEEDDGTMRLTPAKADDREKIDQILIWGSNDYDGWRVGALLVNDLDSDEPLTAGETAGVRYFLQNVTDQPKSILIAPMGEAIPVMGAGGRINLNTHAGSGTIELTAQPGEAVSPDGFYVLIDTTGLPDGEYELDTTAAFWMQNDDGGSSSPWRVGAVPMTIGAGGKFDGEPMTDEEGIVWGGTVAGLRVGMRLPEGKKQWANGSLLQGDLFVKNTTTQPIEFSWDKPAPMDQNQVVYTAEGEYVQLNRVFYTGARAQNPQTFTVEPGWHIALGDALLQSVAEASEPGPEDPAQLVATTGSFTWQVHVQLNVPAIPQFLFVVGSGPVPFEIVTEDEVRVDETPERFDLDGGDDADPLIDNGVSEAQAENERTGELSILHEDEDGSLRLTPTNAVDQETINQLLAWGSNDYDGWRVGTLLMNSLESDESLTAGDTAHVRFFLQNITDQPRTIVITPLGAVWPVIEADGQINLNLQAGSGTIEITAQPGEAVSPEGCRANIDTTGLPDGDYEFWSMNAFWTPNPDGDGAGVRWGVGRLPMTIGAGGEFEGPSTDEAGIAWGHEFVGLQFGIRMRDGQTKWPAGSDVEVELFAKNLTDRAISFTWSFLPPGSQPHFYGFQAVIQQTFTVEAGQQISLGTKPISSVTDFASPTENDPPPQAELGEFDINMYLQIRVESMPQFTMYGVTGSTPYEIVAADAVGMNDAHDDSQSSELSVLHESEDGTLRFTPANEEERALVDQILVWTDPVDGWRVGSLLMNDLESDEPLTRGDTAKVRYFMQNVSDQPMSITVAPIDGWSRDLRAGGWMVIETLPGSGPVEFSAAPGEAVSPPGFSVDVDTTGLVDGQYELDATTVFWRQDANGNGASSPWRVAGVPVTVGTGGSLATETMTDDEGVHWGEVVSGLRLGMKLVDGKHEWAVGSLIEADLYVKNTTEEPITFTWDAPPPGEQGQTIYNSDWEVVQLNAAFYSGLRPSNPQSFTVEPGEQVTIGKALLQSVAEASTPGPSDPMQLVAASGSYYWVMNVFVQVTSVPQIGILLGSGTEEFEIVAAEADATSSLQPDDRDDAATDELESSISWGEPADGWRAGMRIEGDAQVESGEQVTVQFYVQNMSDVESTLWFNVIDGAFPFVHAGGVIRCHPIVALSAPRTLPTTITAAPGEIAQLRSHSITLDTTGLPDGDYLVEANEGNHANWLCDSEGRASKELLVTSARLRIGGGGQFPDVSSTDEVGPVDRIFWGYDVAGLRLGIQMRNQQLEWPVGSRIEARIVAENLTDHEIEFTTSWGLPPSHDIRIFEDPDTPVALDIRELTVFQNFNRTFRVAAGEQVDVGTLAVDSRAEVENYEAGQPPRLVADEGTFRWEAAFNVTRTDLPNWTTRLATGRAYFDLTE